MDINELRAGVAIDRLAIDEELATHSAKFLYVSDLYSAAEEKMEKLKDFLGRVEGIIAKRTREALENEGKKITDKMIDAYIRGDPDYVKSCDMYLTAKTECARLKNLRDAYFMRKDLLVCLAYNERADKKSLNTSVVVS